ncbi:BTB/POZ domain and ankyrin repeat-containing protein NPR1 isoform X2 [Diospyros lotus]|uniref:BTB/POZ domain and ankyrin repeat-containing protein NPR1 isoform X2 n=1 Tax=Diospyros lotus TaxID=55363 RepID=UPI0022583747|nr:BTB/POZ domain and ankyrin repeat-containing protein NPR1 isoform X2 [Diospyros lotus]
MAGSDSNDLSGSSSICCVTNTESHTPPLPPPEIAPLVRLSDNLESAFDSSPDFDYFADAKIAVADGREVAVHRCILSARSPFFRTVFGANRDKAVRLELKELAKDLEVGFEALVAVLVYLYSGKVRSLPEGVCVCVDDECSHVACRPVVDFMVQVLYTSSTFQISELVALYQRHLLDILDKVTADDILVVLSVAHICGKACEILLTRCIHNIVRIHRALDSDDVELVRMLLKEGHTTLDDACALHYAVAYCDVKTTTELLDLGIADVNHKNARGYTVLHVAAMRREPKIIVFLLTKGARPADRTPDGRKAIQISKRLTRAVNYHKSTEEGKASPRDLLCIEILEQAERRNPLPSEASLSLAMAGDDLRMKLLYLENRVGLAKLLFPMEAKVAMDIAQVDGTSEFTLAGINSTSLAGGQRTTVDLNDAPFIIKEEHLDRLKALSKTVELGKRFFPRCSEVLNKIMDADDLSQLAYMENESAQERQLKKERYLELQEILCKAFDEDKEDFGWSTLSSSSSSTSIDLTKPNGTLIFKK